MVDGVSQRSLSWRVEVIVFLKSLLHFAQERRWAAYKDYSQGTRVSHEQGERGKGEPRNGGKRRRKSRSLSNFLSFLKSQAQKACLRSEPNGEQNPEISVYLDFFF